MVRLAKYTTLVLCIITSLLVTTAQLACKSGSFSPPPSIPAMYYQCLEADPNSLVNAYYTHYLDRSIAQMIYDGGVFVLKNIELTLPQVERLRKESCVWVGLVKCLVTNIADCMRFKPGEKVDVVGTNKGASPEFIGITFVDCYVIPTGSLQLPAEGDSQLVIAGY